MFDQQIEYLRAQYLEAVQQKEVKEGAFIDAILEVNRAWQELREWEERAKNAAAQDS